MPLISQEEATEVVREHFPALYKMPMEAWDRYHMRVPEDLLASFCARTRASAVHDLMIAAASAYAMGSDNVQFFDSYQMLGLLIDRKIAIRLKKFDEESKSRSQPTRQVTRFRAQERIDGIEALHHLELGYVTNDAATEIAEVRLACPSGEGVAWWMRLTDGGAESVVADLFDPNGGSPSPIPPIIKPKESGIILPFSKADER